MKLDPKGKEKQPYAIAMADGGQVVMAGLWEKWKSPQGEEVLKQRTSTNPADLRAARQLES